MASFIGIDVGGPRKGMHAVALNDGVFEICHLERVDVAVDWVLDHRPAVVAIDAPCSWARSGNSRECERTLELGGQTIRCFATPTREQAAGNAFYDWVRHGLELYAALAPHFHLYGMGDHGNQLPLMMETFPQAVACHLAGERIPSRQKSAARRRVLELSGFPADPQTLPNIDYVDAALCAITAREYASGQYAHFGNPDDGYIVVAMKP